VEYHAERYGDLTLRGFVDRLASGDPIPGGGSASAVAASLGAALVAMVAALSEGREKYAEHQGLIRDARRRAQTLTTTLLDIADEDAAAYAEFGASLKLPRGTNVEQATRKERLGTTALVAAEVPLRCVEACREVVALAEALAGRSNRNASSDLAVAALLGEAAARGATANVLVNVPSIGDAEAADQLVTRAKLAMDEVEALAATTREIVQSGEARSPVDLGGR
jgi:formiminotetrahydrofolate cyclodeaminase